MSKSVGVLKVKKFRGTWQNSSENTNRWRGDPKQANDNKNEIDFQRKTNSRTMENVIYRAGHTIKLNMTGLIGAWTVLKSYAYQNF